jgi:flavin reductase (DIM6/NTAB) family NADH-FMN oxidoreductase RutF
LSAGNGTKKDAMTATSMFVSEDPPLFVVSIDRRHLTHALIEETGQFILNVASIDQVKLARGLGSIHGEKVDKFKKFAIETEKAKVVRAPIIKGSYVSIECNVITSFPVSTYTVYLANAVDFTVNKTLTPLAWHFNRYYSIKDEVK